jgi:hypothetical protein
LLLISVNLVDDYNQKLSQNAMGIGSIYSTDEGG